MVATIEAVEILAAGVGPEVAFWLTSAGCGGAEGESMGGSLMNG
jgi:hypothetical protein